MSSEKVGLGLSQSLLGPQHLPTLVRHRAGFGTELGSVYFIGYLFFLFFGHGAKRVGSLFRDQGSKLKLRVLTTLPA